MSDVYRYREVEARRILDDSPESRFNVVNSRDSGKSTMYYTVPRFNNQFNYL